MAHSANVESAENAGTAVAPSRFGVGSRRLEIAFAVGFEGGMIFRIYYRGPIGVGWVEVDPAVTKRVSDALGWERF